MRKIFLTGIVAGLLIFAGMAGAAMGPGMGGTGTGGTGTIGGTMGSVMLQMPMAQQMFSYGPTSGPVTSSDVTTMMPIGVGSVAMGGTNLGVQVATGQFASPADMYFALYAPSIDPFNIYMMHPDGSLQPVSSGMEPWMSGVTSVNQPLFGNIPTSALPKGTYYMGLMATPAGANMSTYYLWMTHFTIQ